MNQNKILEKWRRSQWGQVKWHYKPLVRGRNSPMHMGSIYHLAVLIQLFDQRVTSVVPRLGQSDKNFRGSEIRHGAKLNRVVEANWCINISIWFGTQGPTKCFSSSKSYLSTRLYIGTTKSSVWPINLKNFWLTSNLEELSCPSNDGVLRYRFESLKL